ncbi:MAG: TonB-dependent receptor [Acidobacteria bacterium]|nr:TonB-dependent receptor [Acidobacteriota bacterium]
MKRLIALSVTLFLTAFALCQSTTGTLIGTVSDASGVIPGAKVEAINSGTGIVVASEANQEGIYRISNLVAGTYTLKISAPGYKSVEIKNAHLVLNQTLRNNVVLAVGGVTETVEVHPDAGVTTSDSPSIATVTDSKALVELPANGRTISAILATAPGNSGDGSDSNPKISGSQHWGGTSFQVNGVNYDDRGNGGGSYAYSTSLTTQPSLDTIQDVKIESNAAKAEYASSVAVVMTTKGGTNSFHGTAFEFNRNMAVSANEYFAKLLGTPRLPFNRNEFGGTIGGPIVRNHTFFFFSIERFTQRQQRQGIFTVPTDAQRTGQFTTTIKNPYTGTNFPNNKIPDSMLNAKFQAILALVPHANTSFATSNLKQPRANNLDLNRYSGKLDHTFNARNKISFDANWAESGLYYVNLGYPVQYGNYSDAGFQTKSGALTYTRVLSSSMVNEFRASYYTMRSTRLGQNTNFDGRTLFPGLYPHEIGGIPIFSMTSYTRIGDVGGSRSNPQMTQQYGDTFLWNRGRHTIKAGADVQITKVSTNPGSSTTTLGYFNFLSSRYTGNGLGNALLGIPTSTLRSTASPSNVIHQNRYGFYVQDDWQVMPRLSLYYGLRYELQTEPTERFGGWTNFDFNTGSLIIRSVGGQLPSSAIPSLVAAYPYKTSEAVGWGSDVLVADRKNFAPRFGFAFRPFSTNDVVLRGGYGIFYNMPAIYQGIYQLGVSNPPFKLTQQYNGGTTPTISLDDPFATSPIVTANPVLYSVDRNLHNTYSQQWNLSLENKLPGAVGLRISYVGNRAIHAPYVNYDMNRPRTLAAPTSPTQTNQDFLPYQPYSNIYGMRFTGTGFTNQLQVQGTRRFNNSLYLQTNLSWTKSLDDVPDTGSPQNPYNQRGDYGNADGVRKITFYFTGGYELPFGRGKMFLNNRGDFVSRLVGGIRVTSVTKLLSGAPYSVLYTSTAVNAYASRADINPAGGDPNTVPNRSLTNWINVNAFKAPATYGYGNSARNMLFGPGQKIVNLSVAKTTPLYEKVSLELRADAFNLTNSTNFANPANSLNVAGFGVVSATATDPRQLQFGAKVLF